MEKNNKEKQQSIIPRSDRFNDFLAVLAIVLAKATHVGVERAAAIYSLIAENPAKVMIHIDLARDPENNPLSTGTMAVEYVNYMVTGAQQPYWFKKAEL